ncbi:MAG: sigma-70 family RNA polymerase sigma factor [Acetobacteraceae bacterium]|nr:sigma-70 family RNA polymerase sigma factor [Acetobacteraceae bacterium]MBV8526017.1 sigma-70 family RNA polymerase sigma factor [Acetobacteraceae bacterium]MBV8592589.1 sigma-70 family RNA polymerase sigma factor [Acetobacteraceae bacterium]
MPGVLTRVEACIPALRRYAVALLRNPQDADDLVHDCLVRALGRLHTIRDETDVRPWLFAIMHNLFISQLRQAKLRGNTAPLSEQTEAASSLSPGQEAHLQWGDLMRGLYTLPEEQRTVLLLVAVEDLSYADVAKVLDVPIGTVMSRLSRARERLRRIMEGEAQPPLRRVK